MPKKEDRKKVGDRRGCSSKQAQNPPQPVEREDVKLLHQYDIEGTTTSLNETMSKVLPGIESSTPVIENPSDPYGLSELMKQKNITTMEIERLEKIEIEKQTRRICNKKESLEKILEMSDTSEYLNRLALSEGKFNAIILPLLKDEERDDVNYGLDTDVYDKWVTKYHMTLIYDSVSKIYVLTKEWRKFCSAYKLKPYKDSVKLWAFRHCSTDSLCFYIVVSTENESPKPTSEVSELKKQVSLLYKNEKPLEKQLDESDTNEDQDTLALPTEYVQSIILPLSKGNERVQVHSLGLDVDVYDRREKKYHMKFKYNWKSSNYCLTGGWKSFRDDYELKPYKDSVELWVFRHYITDSPSFYIIVLTENESEPGSVTPETTVPEAPSEFSELEKQVSLLCKNEKPLEKQLDESDANEDRDTLVLPNEDVKCIILPLLKLSRSLEVHDAGVNVDVYDPRWKTYHMTFGYKWDSDTYCLTGGWKRFCKDYKLRTYEDSVELWAFLHYSTHNLCFYIVVLTENESVTLEPTLEVLELEKQITLLCENEKPLKKQLDESDANKDQDTLNLPTEDVNSIILPWFKLYGRHDLHGGLVVDVYNPSMEKYPMTFKYNQNSNNYCLTGGWESLCDDYNLIAYEDSVQLWAFRHYSTHKLCFVIGVEKMSEQDIQFRSTRWIRRKIQRLR